ncbi:winged helix-turn-helix domain-containing protein [Cuneatibacter caecimuris]|uniref:winged helix-turn-helix domain-containing protein n=1 Tax=Cuneatibacter caecimuris TaxID=1796618 RepID=UPI00102CD0A0|nr:helix-turn-helix domain-containing protein [Cuneatibacter caecimuris]
MLLNTRQRQELVNYLLASKGQQNNLADSPCDIPETYCSRKAVNNHVSNLRKKLKITSDSPDHIKSVVGVGYKFEAP